MVTASAGNHGRALAMAAEQLGLSCVVFTPASAPETKKNAIRRHGAILHSECEDYDAAEKQAKEFADAEGGVYVSAYSHPDVIAGAGTIGLEIIEAMPQFDVVVIPLGGGGLASGVGLALKAAAPQVTIVGVEVEASSPFTLSLEAGRITEITPRPSLADGLVGNLEPGIDHLPARQAGRGLRRHGERGRARPRHEGTCERGAADRRRRGRGVGGGADVGQGVGARSARDRDRQRRQRRPAEVAVDDQLILGTP